MQQSQLQQDHQTVEIQTVQHHVGQNHQPQTVTIVSGNQNILSTINSPQSQESSPHRPQYVCRECGSGFNSKEAHALHMRLHTGDKNLMTDLCALTAAIPGLSFQGGGFRITEDSLKSINNRNFSSIVVPSSPVPVQIVSSTGQVIGQTQISHSSPQQTQVQVQTTPTPQQPTQIKYETVQMISQQPVQQQTQTIIQQVTQQKPKSHFCGHCGEFYLIIEYRT